MEKQPIAPGQELGGEELMEPTWLSILMPVYNGERYLTAALESVAVQASRRIEIVVVDDGSTDSTFSILKEFKDRLRIRVIERPRLANWVAITNLALSLAQGEYACLLHQDDLWLEGRLIEIDNQIRNYPNADLFLQPAWFVDSAGKRLGMWRSPLYEGRLLEPDDVLEHLLVQNFIPIVAPVFRRVTAIKVGGFDEGLWYTADWDFWLKMASNGLTIHSSRPLSAFRVHSTSQTEVRSANVADYRLQLESVLNKHLKGWNTSVQKKRSTDLAARFSVEVNTTLAALGHGRVAGLLPLALMAARIGPSGLGRYLRDSGVVARVYSRLRARTRF